MRRHPVADAAGVGRGIGQAPRDVGDRHESRLPPECTGIRRWARAIAAAPHPLGDGLVPVASALGRHRDPRLDLGFAPGNTHLVTETGHLDLLSSPEVYRTIRDWLAAPG